MSESKVFVYFDVGASDTEVAQVQAVFDAAAVDARVSTEPFSIVASADLPDVDAFVIVTAPFVASFLARLGSKAADATWDFLTRLVQSLRRARPRDDGRIRVIIRDEEGGPEIVIGPDVPDEAIGRLLTEPLPQASSGPIVYDPVLGIWRYSKTGSP